MHVWMHGRMYRQKDIIMDGWFMAAWMDGLMDDGFMDACIDECCMHGWRAA